MVEPVHDAALGVREGDLPGAALAVGDDGAAHGGGLGRAADLGDLRADLGDLLDQLRGRAGQARHEAVVGADGDRLRSGDDREEAVELADLRGQRAVVAVGDDEVAVAGQGGQREAFVAADRPDLVGPAGLVDVGGDRFARARDGLGDGGVELVAAAGLEQQDGAEEVPQLLVELVALLDLLDEDVLVADDLARFVGRGGDLRGVDHAEHPVGHRLGAAGDAVGDGDVAEGGEAPGLLQGGEALGRGGEGLLEAQPGRHRLGRVGGHLDAQDARRIRLDDPSDLGLVGELVVVLRRGLTGGEPGLRYRVCCTHADSVMEQDAQAAAAE